METTALAVVEPQEAVSLLESPLSPAETAELQSCELAIELAGKDRLEKALIIGEKLSTIYNHALFRGADGGCTWEQWLKERLPKLLPEAEGRSTDWGDGRRLLWEEWLHSVSIPVDVRNVVIAVARGTNTATHKFLQKNRIRIEKVENKVNVDTVLWQHLCLNHSSRHSIQQKNLSIFVKDFTSILDHIHGSIIVDKVTLAQSITQVRHKR